MGQRCHTLQGGYINDDLFGSFDDMAGTDRGDSVSECSDRGDGEWGESDYLGDLGNAGGSLPRAQASSSGPQGTAAEEVAIPGASLGSRPPASGTGDLGAVSLRPLSQWPGHNIPLGRPPAHSSEINTYDSCFDDPMVNPAADSWSRGPPVALPSHDEATERYTYESGEGARGTREIDNTISSVVHAACWPPGRNDHEAIPAHTRGGAPSSDGVP